MHPCDRSRIITAVALLAGVLAGCGWVQVARAAATRPHIVVIMADDLDVVMTESMLSLGLLPNIKANVVDRGVRFDESFVSNPVCCPSRSTFLTGRYSHNHGVLRNNAPRGSVTALADSSTLATWLRAAGYRTAYVGKYLNGYGIAPAAPPANPQNPAYVPPGWDEWHALVGAVAYRVFGYTINHNGTLQGYGSAANEYQTAVLSDIAARVVANALALDDKPLFLVVTPLAPHVELWTILQALLDGADYPDIWQAYIRPDWRDLWRKPTRWNLIFRRLPLLTAAKEAFNESDVTDKPAAQQRPTMSTADITNLTRQYRMAVASMLSVDDLVGAVARALGPQLANTVLVFTSDNGSLYGEHRLGGKTAAYEESIRVPLYVSGANVVGERSVDELVVNNDLAPTIAALAGAPPAANVDGRSLVPLLQDTGALAWRRRFLIEHLTAGMMKDVPTYEAVRTGPTDVYPSRLYIEYFGNPTAASVVTDVELYDLTADPNQLYSLHADPSRSTEREVLHAQLAMLRSCAPTSVTCQAAEE